MFCILIHKCLFCPLNLPVNTHVLHEICSSLLCQCYPLSYIWEIIPWKWSFFFLPQYIHTNLLALLWCLASAPDETSVMFKQALSTFFCLRRTPHQKYCYACTSEDLFACHLDHFWCGCSYMCTSKSVYFPPVLLTDKKVGLLRFQTNKLFWFNSHHTGFNQEKKFLRSQK